MGIRHSFIIDVRTDQGGEKLGLIFNLSWGSGAPCSSQEKQGYRAEEAIRQVCVENHLSHRTPQVSGFAA